MPAMMIILIAEVGLIVTSYVNLVRTQNSRERLAKPACHLCFTQIPFTQVTQGRCGLMGGWPKGSGHW